MPVAAGPCDMMLNVKMDVGACACVGASAVGGAVILAEPFVEVISSRASSSFKMVRCQCVVFANAPP